MINKIFNNSGNIIKIIAIITFFAITIGGIFAGLILSEDGDDDSLILIPIAPVVALIISIFIYGFGEIVCHVKNIDEKLNNINNNF